MKRTPAERAELLVRQLEELVPSVPPEALVALHWRVSQVCGCDPRQGSRFRSGGQRRAAARLSRGLSREHAVSLRRVLCRFLGHRPGAEVFCYANPSREIGQWPHRRGPATFAALGRECARCRAVVKERA